MNLIIMSRYVICYREEWRRTTSLRNQNDKINLQYTGTAKSWGPPNPPFIVWMQRKAQGVKILCLFLYFLQHLMSIKNNILYIITSPNIRDVSNQSRCMSTIGITTSRRQKNIPATCRLPWDNDENIPCHPSIIIMG